MTEKCGGYDPYNNPPDLEKQLYPCEMLYFKQPKPVAVIDMGGMTVHVTKRYNWFHRTMMRLVFGWKVQNL